MNQVHTSRRRRQVVLPIDGRHDMLTADIRGGKGSSLAVMQRLGLPVPPAFTVSTTVMRAYLETGALPKRLEHQLEREISRLERKTGKKFGDRSNPLLLSVRSGAATSMPGMMDTILNLGMTSEVLIGFRERSDGEFARIIYERFLLDWQKTVLDGEEVFTITHLENPWTQLTQAILAVIGSWDNPRAKTYRKHHGIPEHLGTAVNVQTMVFGNRDECSGTGVVFSHDVNTGDHGLYGEFLPNAQGEELVAGKRTPHPIAFLKEWNPTLYGELSRAVEQLALHEQSMVEVEFTIESGKLWFLQHRKAKGSLEARITSLVHALWKKKKNKGEILREITFGELEGLNAGKRFDPVIMAQKIAEGTVLRGIAASPGAACGCIVLSSQEAVERSQAGEKVILFRPETDPDDLPGMLAAEAIMTLHGGATCHAAVVARALNKPAVVGIEVPHGTTLPVAGEVMSLDGSTGIVVSGRVPITEITLKKEVSLYLKWKAALDFPKPRVEPTYAYQPTSVSDLLKCVYLADLMAHEAKKSELEFEAACLKREWYTEAADVFLCYLVLAVASELRHADPQDSVAPRNVDTTTVAKLAHWGTFRRDSFHYTFFEVQKASEEVVKEFLTVAVHVFRDYQWPPSFGGPRWATIAETALWFLEGKIGHTVFVDRVFDLQHNTGKVFNKHAMLINGQTEVINELLDKKKMATTLRDLRSWWTGGFTKQLDTTLEALYQKGNQLNIWRS